MNQLPILLYALIGGVVPALFWLYFWLREDSNPEPLALIIKTFLAGSAMVILVIPFQKVVNNLFLGMGVTAFILWATLEEGFKFAAAYFIAIRSLDDDEPVDPMIYMIVVALGFVALENTLFIVSPLLQKDLINGLLTGNLRFIGASLLHIVSSSIIGTAIALNYYKPKAERYLWTVFAFIMAVTFHSVFNLFIINQNDFGTFMTFGMVWSGVAILLLMFEKIKRIKLEKVINSISTTDELYKLN